MAQYSPLFFPISIHAPREGSDVNVTTLSDRG